MDDRNGLWVGVAGLVMGAWEQNGYAQESINVI
jgi:hypothetical protein